MYSEASAFDISDFIDQLRASVSINDTLGDDIFNVVRAYFPGKNTPEVILIDLRNNLDSNINHGQSKPADVVYLSACRESEKSVQNKKLTDSQAVAYLTKREKEVLGLIAKGLSYNEISHTLIMSLHTVTSHVKHIYKKLQVRSRGEATFEAMQLGLVKIDHQ